MSRQLLVPLLIAIITTVNIRGCFFNLNIRTSIYTWHDYPFIICLNTFYKKVPNPDSILTLYLVLLGIQFIHFTEEYLTDFNIEVPLLLGQEAYPKDYWLPFNMVAYSIFTIGGLSGQRS
ncbi:MAG: hypothetical protein OEV74_03540 [Cyclobacteriaceae bacterium]|nr:hypothetical protein [Cyclobacteriaceae bacterium]MDH4295329.1 hypothetical protein [Cyclobacteriaceae bacterium]MDH5250440.1 hypothetical protein [Cyclobacteriaceae bacterium]